MTDHRELPQYGKPIVDTVDGKVRMTCDKTCGHQSIMDAEEAWDFGDDLIIAAGRVWGDAGPPGDWLEDGAVRQLFTDEQIQALQGLADERGKTVPALIREEMIACVEFSKWAETFQEELGDT